MLQSVQFQASRTARGDEAFPGDPDAYPTITALSLSPDGARALGLLPVVIGCCGVFLFNELAQLIVEGPVAYFNSIWNYVDVFGFGLQLVASGSWLARGDEYSTRALLSIGSLLLFFKILYFARGFPQWGPLVRMLVTIVEDMRSFLLILMVFVVSFAVAFVVFNASEQIASSKFDDVVADDDDGGGIGAEGGLLVDAMLFVMSSAVFGDKTGYTPADSSATDLVLPTRTMNTFLFSLLMVIVNIILLNLLIAIMADSYGRVQQYSQLEAMYERASIIIEMEQTMLPLANGLRRWGFAVTFRYRATRTYLASLVRGKEPSAAPKETLREAWAARVLEIQRENFPTWLHVIKTGGNTNIAGATDDKGNGGVGGGAGADQAVMERLEKLEALVQTSIRLMHRVELAAQKETAALRDESTGPGFVRGLKKSKDQVEL